jgi:AcrR family transcriptional regulator
VLASLAALFSGMTIAERRERERSDRRRLIASSARAIAEREGWDAVTTRRLSTEIEYSQPVIYKHFASLDEITDAVALEGFAELAQALRTTREAAAPGDAVRAVAHRYCAFATDAPALYDSMFSRTTRLRFGSGSVPELSAAFAELRAAVAPGDDGDASELLTETLWSALHGLVVLERSKRLRSGRLLARIDLVVNGLMSAGR